MLILYIIGALALIYIGLQLVRAPLYDWVIVKMTAQWYKGVLSRLDENSSLLDVGIGTGAALVRNKGLVAQKKLRVVGVDYDADYVRRCAALFGEHGMQGSCAVVHQSFYDFKGLPPAAAISASSGQSDSAEAETKFDAVYFSGSLMIMPDAAGALRHAAGLLRSPATGCIYVTQTIQQLRNPVMERLKPLLRFLTTIDFGKVTYLPQFEAAVSAAGLVIAENALVPGTAAGKFASFRMFVLKVKSEGSASGSRSR